MFNAKTIPFNEMGFSELWQDYQEFSTKIHPFFEYNPYNVKDLETKSSFVTKNYSTDRNQLVKALKDYYKRIGVPKKAHKALDRLLEPSTFTITTGQQLGLLGGPAFTLYKALTCVLLAKKAATKLNVDVVPVFWIADEDHDFEEIRSVLTLNSSKTHSFEIKANKSGKTVADISIDNEIGNLFEQLLKVHQNEHHALSIIKSLREFYKEGNTHLQAFGQQMAWLLTELGMVLVGSNDFSIKELVKKPLKMAVSYRLSIKKALLDKTKELAQVKYPQQVQVGNSLLFKFDENSKARLKLEYLEESESWVDESSNTFNDDQLINSIHDNPENYSPNVFLRPVLQDTLLPNIGYVAGPGELNYYAQTKDIYQIFGLSMPIIYPRLSCTIIKSQISRKVEQLGWPIKTYRNRPEQLSKELVEQNHSNLSLSTFKEVEASIKSELNKLKQQVLAELPNQTAVYDRLNNILENEFNRLYSKYISEHKKKNSIDISRLHTVANVLFPNQQLQERTLSLVSLLFEYGESLPQHLLSFLESIESFGNHLLIEVEQPSTH